MAAGHRGVWGGADRALDSAQLERMTLRQPIVAGTHSVHVVQRLSTQSRACSDCHSFLIRCTYVPTCCGVHRLFISSYSPGIMSFTVSGGRHSYW